VSRPAVFLDRDGTIIEEKGFLNDPNGVEILPTVVDALRLLREHGFATVVVSNQSGVARGYFDDDAVRAVNDEVTRRLANDGVAIDAWYWCSHYDEECECRKPAPGMIRRAVEEHGLTLQGGAMIGDRGSDVALGHAVGIPGILLPCADPYDGPEPDFRAATLLDAAEWVVRRRTLRQAQDDARALDDLVTRPDAVADGDIVAPGGGHG
jgi:histidinol-phosphate phosphatase family protein